MNGKKGTKNSDDDDRFEYPDFELGAFPSNRDNALCALLKIDSARLSVPESKPDSLCRINKNDETADRIHLGNMAIVPTDERNPRVK